MITEKYNLKCKKGHYHFAPQPELWVGRPCAKPFENPLTVSGDIRVVAKRCDQVLRRIRAA